MSAMIYPRTHNHGALKGKKDKRYTITLEYDGHISGKPRYVLRFCDKYIEGFQDIPSATLRAVNHHAEFMGEPVFVNRERA